MEKLLVSECMVSVISNGKKKIAVPIFDRTKGLACRPETTIWVRVTFVQRQQLQQCMVGRYTGNLHEPNDFYPQKCNIGVSH